MYQRANRRGDEGAAAVELAMVVSLFLTILLGTIDFGYFLYVSEVVTNAAREGARAGSAVGVACEPLPTCLDGLATTARSEAQKAATNYLTRGRLAGTPVLSTGVILNGAPDAPCAGDANVAVPSLDSVCVDLSYPVGSLTGFFSAIMPTYSHAHAVMRWQ
jgi:hypothetical protein